MQRRFLLTTLVLVTFAAAAHAAEPVTFTSLLAEMVDRDAIARLPVPRYRCLDASSYDRAQTDPKNLNTWFANHDYEQFIRTETNEGRKEWVIMEHSGPGAIVRFWAPMHQPTDNQIVRFYFDGAKTPAIAVKINDLFRGKLFAKPPFTFVATDEKTDEGVAGDFYLPIPFAKGCKITLDSLPFYYNINYRAYEPGTLVKTFSMGEFEAAIAHLKKTADVLAARQPIGIFKTVAPGQEEFLDSREGSYAIRSIDVWLDTKDLPQVLRDAVVIATFDGEQTIWCPLGDFFGSGVRFEMVADRYRNARESGKLTAGWVMPYYKSGRIAIKNCGKKPFDVDLSLSRSPWHWDDRSMHFHATWRHQYPIETKRAAGTMDWNYLEAKGQGVYVGDTLTVFSPSKAWYGEGDERVYVDDEKFPSHLGTGTEDYYGYAWGMGRQFSSPFISMPRRDGASRDDWRGYTTTSRVRLLDGIPFERSLKFDMEIWDWEATKLDYSAATFWYARPGATSNRPPAPEEAARPLLELPQKKKIAGAIECESMKIVGQSDGLPIEKQTENLDWSEGTQLFVRGRRVGDYVELAIPASGAGRKKITLYATKSYDYGILRFSINGQGAGKDYDAYSAFSALSGPIELGTFEPKDGQFILRAEVVGANPAARGTKAFFGLDAVRLTATGSGAMADPPVDLAGDPLPKNAVVRCGTLRFLPRDTSWAIAVSPDGKSIVSGSMPGSLPDGIVESWDVATGRRLAVLKSGLENILAIAWSPDGKRLAIGHNYTIDIVEPADGKLIVALPQPNPKKPCSWRICWSADSKKLASLATSGEVAVWEMPSARLLASRDVEKHLLGLALAADGQSLAVCGGGTIETFRTAGMDLLWKLKSSGDDYSTLAFSPDGRQITAIGSRLNAAGSNAHDAPPRGNLNASRLEWFDAASGHAGGESDLFRGALADIAYSPDGKTIITCSGLDVILWDAAAHEKRIVRSPARYSYSGYRFSQPADGSFIASGGRRIGIWRSGDCEQLNLQDAHAGTVTRIAFDTQGGRLYSAAVDGVRQWDARSGRMQWFIPAVDNVPASFWLSNDGQSLLELLTSKAARRWSLSSRREEMITIPGGTGSPWQPYQIDKSCDGKFLAAAFQDSTVRVFRLPELTEYRRISTEGRIIFRIRLSPDAKRLAVAAENSPVRVYQLDPNQEPRIMEVPVAFAFGPLEFIPGTSLLACVSEELNPNSLKSSSSLCFWDYLRGQCEWKGPRFDSYSFAGAASHNGQLFAMSMGKPKEEIWIWDVKRREVIRKLQGHRDEIQCMVFSPDDRRLASGGCDATVMVWNVGRN